jgi:ribosome-associated protein
MIRISPTLTIPDEELSFSYLRASGPGGQNVNKVASAAQLRFDVTRSTALPEEVKVRLARLAGARMTLDGVLIIEARRFRSQERNREDAEGRLGALIQKALVLPKERRPSRPGAAARAKRLDRKKKRGEIKRLRASSGE